jgi:phosphoribosylformylglycinamidine synthase II
VVPHHRLTIRNADTDPRATAIELGAEQLGLPIPTGVTIADLIHVAGHLDESHLARLASFLVDPLLQSGSWETPSHGGPAFEITLHPGVTDVPASTLQAAADVLGVPLLVSASGRRVEFADGTDPTIAESVIARLVANPIIEHWHEGTADPPLDPIDSATVAAEVIAIGDLDDASLDALGSTRTLALDPEELRAIQAHFREERRDPTDVELETLAQTWSEHCAHKTFRAAITTDDGVKVAPLLSQLRDCTDAIDAPFVRSAFVGNAGVVSFDGDTSLALKAETHNHPSAVEPFGGANTGVGGVIRDVLGIAHRPMAVTDILCFGSPDLPITDLPDGALHPRRIRDGVIDGVADYGNKIGLPTIAGAVFYDDRFTTNPLVFCGCVGAAEGWTPHTGPRAGDAIVVVGGRTGRDGIRGATFSSATMDATTGDVAGASVQIGDPVTEKVVIDALIGAEHLYSAITDCGAGGLSSAVGEMAESVGAEVDLDLVPLKYPGLAPWEIWLSEAQERMVIAVPPEHLEEIEQRCRLVGAELAAIGSFTGDGRLRVRHGGATVLDLDTNFLHDGRPQRQMTAVLPSPRRDAPSTRQVADPAATLLALLSHRNIASKAATIHRYDHEIGGNTLVRPLTASGAHADGVVLADPAARHGVAVGIGINPWHGLHDPEAMAATCVDEAIRNVVAVGADPEQVALLDNFSWGDPRRAATLGDLAAAVTGCCTASLAFGAPFVSGKDSLNNEYVGTDGRRHAVPPTLVITAVAHVPDVDRCITPELTASGNALALVGRTHPEFAGSHLDDILGRSDRTAGDEVGVAPQFDRDAPLRYRRLHRAIGDGLVVACHDVSEGGLAVAVAEMCIAGSFGATLDTLPHDDPAVALFAESAGRLIVEVAPEDRHRFKATLGEPVTWLGTVTDEPVLTVADVLTITVRELAAAFHRGDA